MSAALHFAENLDRLPDHDGTILFVARLLTPIATRGGRLPQSVSRHPLTIRKRRERAERRA